jgi:asparagine synthase (glutamine-hydrolysing)
MKLQSVRQARRLDENDPLKRRTNQSTRSDGKALLRDAMSTILPPDVRSRPKQGFSAPDASWFRGESIDYISRLLGNPKAMLYEYIEPAFVRSVLDEHTSGRVNRRLLIWSLLSFEWWCRAFLSGATLDARQPAWSIRDRRGEALATIPH